jgi:hypothetical protein
MKNIDIIKKIMKVTGCGMNRCMVTDGIYFTAGYRELVWVHKMDTVKRQWMLCAPGYRNVYGTQREALEAVLPFYKKKLTYWATLFNKNPYQGIA